MRFYVNSGYVLFNHRVVGAVSSFSTPAKEHRQWTFQSLEHRGYAGGYMPVVFKR